MQFHIGKVLKVIRPDKEIISCDSSVQTVVEMWDGNQLLLNAEASIAPQLKVGDVVLVDYNPIEGISPPVPKQSIVKILRGKQGKECWDLFKKYQSDRAKMMKQREPEGELPGISYSR